MKRYTYFLCLRNRLCDNNFTDPSCTCWKRGFDLIYNLKASLILWNVWKVKYLFWVFETRKPRNYKGIKNHSRCFKGEVYIIFSKLNWNGYSERCDFHKGWWLRREGWFALLAHFDDYGKSPMSMEAGSYKGIVEMSCEYVFLGKKIFLSKVAWLLWKETVTTVQN